MDRIFILLLPSQAPSYKKIAKATVDTSIFFAHLHFRSLPEENLAGAYILFFIL